jgi:hypothetical protein
MIYFDILNSSWTKTIEVFENSELWYGQFGTTEMFLI